MTIQPGDWILAGSMLRLLVALLPTPLWGSLLVIFVVVRRFYPRPNAYLAKIVLGMATLFSATQVALDVAHRH